MESEEQKVPMGPTNTGWDYPQVPTRVLESPGAISAPGYPYALAEPEERNVESY